ncbi:MAG: ABC transporter ATP-binding protein [Actinomycetota bacterium]
MTSPFAPPPDPEPGIAEPETPDAEPETPTRSPFAPPAARDAGADGRFAPPSDRGPAPPAATDERHRPDAGAGDTLVVLDDVTKRYRQGETEVVALSGVDLHVGRGEIVAVSGRSGSGKTTMLNVVGGLEVADEGRVLVCGSDLTGASTADRTAIRRGPVSFVFQAFGLLPVLSAAENVEVPMRLRGTSPSQRRQRVEELLTAVGLERRARHRPAELSGGEQQRVAIARALASEPELIIADEPTGQLDHATGRTVMELFASMVRHRGLSLLVATHDPFVLDDADRRLALRDGHLR